MFAQIKQLFSKDIGLDLGTATTLIYVKGKGIVLRQASAVALHKRDDFIVAIGDAALALQGKEPEGVEVIFPIRDGVIQNLKMTCLMLEEFVKKALPDFYGNPSVVIGVPSGTTYAERESIFQTGHRLGFAETFLVEEPIAAAVGAGVSIHRARGSLVMDIGGGTTDLSVISLAGTVYSYSVRTAGDGMNQAIVDYIRHEHTFLIGLQTAAKIKEAIGSAPGHESTTMARFWRITVGGRSLKTGLPGTIELSGLDIQCALLPCLRKMVNGLILTMSSIPPEVSADIQRYGVILTGGGALLRYMAKYLSQRSGLTVKLAKEPAQCVIYGLRTFVDELHVLRRQRPQGSHTYVPLQLTKAKAA